jgi:predicted transcriptional regulator
MRNRKNKTTCLVLEKLVALGGEGTAQAIAVRAGRNIPIVSMTLLKLLRDGHVSRRHAREGDIVVDQEEGISRPRYVYVYSITPKGVRRLEVIQKGLASEPPAAAPRRRRK